MFKKLSSDEIKLVVGKIRSKYNDLINELKKPESLLNAFEERYITALRTMKDISVFLLAEIEAVNEIFELEKKKREEFDEKNKMKKGKSFADKVFEENSKKIQKYPRVNLGPNSDEEIERLVGAVRKFIIYNWPVLTYIYKNDRTTQYKYIFDNLFDRLIAKIGYNGEVPIARSYLLTLQRFSTDTKKIENEYYMIIKEIAFLLNETLTYLKKVIREDEIPEAVSKLYLYDSASREWYDNYKNLSHKGCIEKLHNELYEIILDFRIKDIKRS